MIWVFNVLNVFYYWILVIKCDKGFVYGKSKRKWWFIYFYFIFKIMLISIFVFVIVIKFKFLFYVENFIIIILVK